MEPMLIGALYAAIHCAVILGVAYTVLWLFPGLPEKFKQIVWVIAALFILIIILQWLFRFIHL